MPKIDVEALPRKRGTNYPAPYDAPCLNRRWRALGDAVGLTQFGVNLVQLPPGSWSSQRHWHSDEDEFVWVLRGNVVLVSDDGEATLAAGECAGFKGGQRNGHCLQNRSEQTAELLVVGARIAGDHGEYPDLDMIFGCEGPYRHRDGSAYPDPVPGIVQD